MDVKRFTPVHVITYENDIDQIAAAVENLRINFNGSTGWGEALLKVLTAIHFAA